MAGQAYRNLLELLADEVFGRDSESNPDQRVEDSPEGEPVAPQRRLRKIGVGHVSGFGNEWAER